MTEGMYILVEDKYWGGYKPVKAVSPAQWGRFMENIKIRKLAEWHSPANDIWVSTVFLGIDHQYGDGPPLLFETMVFRNGSGEECERCSNWDEAVAMHDEMVAKVEAELGPQQSNQFRYIEV